VLVNCREKAVSTNNGLLWKKRRIRTLRFFGQLLSKGFRGPSQELPGERTPETEYRREVHKRRRFRRRR